MTHTPSAQSGNPTQNVTFEQPQENDYFLFVLFSNNIVMLISFQLKLPGPLSAGKSFRAREHQ